MMNTMDSPEGGNQIDSPTSKFQEMSHGPSVAGTPLADTALRSLNVVNVGLADDLNDNLMRFLLC